MAVLQISIPDAALPRVAAAFGALRSGATIPGAPAPQPATQEEVRLALVQYVRQVVRQHELMNAEAEARASVGDLPIP